MYNNKATPPFRQSLNKSFNKSGNCFLVLQLSNSISKKFENCFLFLDNQFKESKKDIQKKTRKFSSFNETTKVYEIQFDGVLNNLGEIRQKVEFIKRKKLHKIISKE